jgi:hypothetical protein
MIIGGQTCSNCGRPSHCGTKLQNTQSFGLNKIPTDKFLVICDSCRCIHCHGVECVSCGTITLDYVKINADDSDNNIYECTKCNEDH